MSDNLKDTGHPDRDLINLHEQWELNYWTKKWGITEAQLKDARRKVGSSNVRKIHDAAVGAGYMKGKL